MKRAVALALMAVSAGAMANAGKVGQILEQQREIREESERATGAYSRFDPEELERMHRAQNRIFDLLKPVTVVEQLDPKQKAELFNALEEVKAIIADNEQDRQVCWREKKLGSAMARTRCATVAERAQIMEGARSWKSNVEVCSTNGSDCGATIRIRPADGSGRGY